MKTLTPNMNKKWPDRDLAASARGMSRVLDKLAKAQGRGKDLLIDPNCTVHDLCRAYIQMTQDEILKSVEDGKRS